MKLPENMLKIVLATLFICNCWTSNPANLNIIDLNLQNFDRLVSNSDHVWIVEFFQPKCIHCKNLLPKYRKFADAVKGVVKVGAVDIDMQDDLRSRFNVRRFPTIMVFNALKNRPAEYKGPLNPLDLVEEALAAVRSKVLANLGEKIEDIGDVVQLTDDTFDRLVMQSDEMWLVEFYAPWCSHCNNLYPEWAKAAAELKGKVRLGALDATTNTVIASKYEIKGYPTIKCFSSGKKDSSSISNYEGGRSANDIVAWALEALADTSPAPDLVQIVDHVSFHKVCGRSVLCILSFLPHILDCPATCRYQYLNTLQDISEHFKKYRWGWAWSEAGTQHDLESALDVGGFGYPTMAVINIQKMKYSVLRGAFSNDGIKEFLRDLTFGRGNTAVIQGAELPEIMETDPWDGKDGILPTEDADILPTEEAEILPTEDAEIMLEDGVVVSEGDSNVKEDL